MSELANIAIRNMRDLQIRQFENTRHELMFSTMFPHLERQVTFGAGKGGLKKWLTKKFTVDFFDRQKNIAYEIDGSSHNTQLGWVNDRLKDHFMKEQGILVVRITNQQVEAIYNEWSKLAREAFNELFNNAV